MHDNILEWRGIAGVVRANRVFAETPMQLGQGKAASFYIMRIILN
jgi:hypothetical protein